ncbi:hypothetical protein QR680_013018 [Steinernema hermaphroditum]|uniref:Uncharacterized protein n=1 Tax=Steinernema hermaphroditum TaxID=289476 RepID=A0AA39M1V3_9BILA|nr:hypothetical protein QR680_013018 [Steinernema hermaphroditum]
MAAPVLRSLRMADGFKAPERVAWSPRVFSAATNDDGRTRRKQLIRRLGEKVAPRGVSLRDRRRVRPRLRPRDSSAREHLLASRRASGID